MHLLLTTDTELTGCLLDKGKAYTNYDYKHQKHASFLFTGFLFVIDWVNQSDLFHIILFNCTYE